jgi:hypothetical protein
MPAVAVGGAFAAIGGSLVAGTATSVVGAVFMGAAVGAVIGAGTALVTGKDPLKGALMGAVTGGVSGGIGQALTAGATAGTTTAGAGVKSGTEAGIGGVGVPVSGSAGLEGAVGPSIPIGGAGPSAAVSTSGPAPVAPTAKTGLLSKAGNWINKNPMAAAIIAQGAGGAASGIAEERAQDKRLDALMERDRLHYASQEIGGLSNLDLKTALPTIGKFTERPEWQMPQAGLIQQWQGRA